MKNAILICIVALFPLCAFCGESWSSNFRFDGSEITEKAILLTPTDPLAYSSTLAAGAPQSLTITVEDTFDPEKSATIFSDYSRATVEGAVCWDFTSEEYRDFPAEDTYLITETIITDVESKALTRKVTILPEPMALIALVLIGTIVLRKRVKALVVFLAMIMLASFNAKADDTVSNVNCLQMWPFDRSVIINYTLSSDSINPVFNVKFYGSTDNGKTTFDLAEKGILSGDGANGIVSGSGNCKTFWTPDESFYETISLDTKVKVEAEEQIQPGNNTYMVIDLSEGTNAASFAVSYLEDVPVGGWTEEYKTTKLVLRKIEAGTFTMGSPNEELGRGDAEIQHEVTLTKPFYAGVFEVTQKQYELITGENPSGRKGDARPVESVSYRQIRGAGKGAGWPTSSEVDSTSFLGILRSKTDANFDLPTEAQWEYACRAGSTTSLNDGNNITNVYEDGFLNELGRYLYNVSDMKGGYTNAHTVVGSYLPNAWGLYDMHGNVQEWCLDWLEDWSGDPATDPKGPAEGSSRIRRGGSANANAGDCRSASRSSSGPAKSGVYGGFRLFLTEAEPEPDPEKYMVINLSGGTNVTTFAISYLEDVPAGGWTEEYKTTKLVLRKIEAGSFTMGSPAGELGRGEGEVQHEVTLTKPFYAGVFEVTQKQYELVTGENPSGKKGDARPVDSVSYRTIRGTSKGTGWPASSDVDENSFLGILRSKTDAHFDLPTEAQWEYACRAGSTTSLNSGKNLTDSEECSNMDEVGRYLYNYTDGKGGYSEKGHTTVGSYLPNAWGLYDMHGNVQEWCLDWEEDWSGDSATDPKGPEEGSNRIRRGGSINAKAGDCRSAARSSSAPKVNGVNGGFRLFLSEAEPEPAPDKYMVIDLSEGTNATSFAISYLNYVPVGGWTEEYKTTKLVLRKIKAGSFTMGSPLDELGRNDGEIQHKVTLTRPFYAGVFEVTQKQYELITGQTPSKNKGDARPVESVSYNAIRGANIGSGWPDSSEVDTNSFLWILRSKTDADFDLPTEAQWEYACRAGSTTSWNDGNNITNIVEDGYLNELGRYSKNQKDWKGDYGKDHTTVGSYLPNAWGLYDMHGNVQEWCLDWSEDWSDAPAIDPKGAEEGSSRVRRSGSVNADAGDCRSASRANGGPGKSGAFGGFRLFLVE